MSIRTPRIMIGAALVAAILLATTAYAEIALPPVIADHMVLQRKTNAPVWGTASPNAKIAIAFRGNSATATADATGKWQTKIATGKAGGPFAMTISGDGTKELKDILVGDVWLASGQSNMFRAGATNTPAEAKGKVRLFTDHWETAPVRATIVGWQFALALHKSEGIPMAVLSESVGGTPIRRWFAVPQGKTDNDLYKKHVAPLVPYTIKGAIWWQGETDRYSGLDYEKHLSKLITEWRQVFHQGDFPFLFVQLQNIGDTPGGYIEKWRKWDLLRVGQMRTLGLPNTGMAVTYDITTGDLHPVMKERLRIAQRLAHVAQAMVYGHDIPALSPIAASAAIQDGKVAISFSNTGAGLKINGDAIRDLDIKPKGGEFQPARATVKGNTLLVDIGNLKPPVFVRYAIRQYIQGNLFSTDGLPASPFITDAIAPDKPWNRDMPKGADFPTEWQQPSEDAPKPTAKPASQDMAAPASGELVIDEFDDWKGWSVSGISNCDADISAADGIVTIKVPRDSEKRDMWAAGKSMALAIGGERTLKARVRATKNEPIEIRIKMEDGKLHSISKYAKASGDWQTMEFAVKGQSGSLIYLILGEPSVGEKDEAPFATYEFDRLWIE